MGKKSIIKKAKPAIIGLLIIGAVVLGVMWAQNQDKIIQGRVEGEITSHVSEVSGKILEMPIQLGQSISQGDLIAKIDSTEWEYALEQLEIAYDIARVQKTNTTGLASNMTKLAGLEMTRIQSQIKQAQRMVDKCNISAAATGIVMSKNYSIGDVIAPGFDLADICGTEACMVIAYLPVGEFSKLSYGDALPFKYKGELYQGEIQVMDVKSTYMPEELKTNINRNKENLRVKLSIPDNCNIMPGEMVEIDLNNVKGN